MNHTNAPQQAMPVVEIKCTCPSEPEFVTISRFAREIYLERLEAKIEGDADMFAYATLNGTLAVCLGLTRAQDDKQLMCEKHIEGAYEKISGQAGLPRNKFAEIGTRALRVGENPPSNIRSIMVAATTVLVAKIVVEGYKLGIEHMCFTANRGTRWIVERFGASVIDLGEPDDSKKDEAFLKNWERYRRTRRRCYGFKAEHYVAGCLQILENPPAPENVRFISA